MTRHQIGDWFVGAQLAELETCNVRGRSGQISCICEVMPHCTLCWLRVLNSLLSGRMDARASVVHVVQLLHARTF
ncbi:hypothetical protein Peur_064734 [Populus x canadensis]